MARPDGDSTPDCFCSLLIASDCFLAETDPRLTSDSPRLADSAGARMRVSVWVWVRRSSGGTSSAGVGRSWKVVEGHGRSVEASRTSSAGVVCVPFLFSAFLRWAARVPYVVETGSSMSSSSRIRQRT